MIRFPIFSLAILNLLFISCDVKKDSKSEFKKTRKEQEYDNQLRNVIVFLDSTNSDPKKLESDNFFKKIDSLGKITLCSMNDGLELYKDIIHNTNHNSSLIIENKNNEEVMISFNGQGLWSLIWAKVLIDKTSKKIIKIEIEHKAETPGLGAEISNEEFENKFRNLSIESDSNVFSLYQKDSLVIRGKNRIDGLSGATFSSIGVIEMMNLGLSLIKKYFE